MYLQLSRSRYLTPFNPEFANGELKAMEINPTAAYLSVLIERHSLQEPESHFYTCSKKRPQRYLGLLLKRLTLEFTITGLELNHMKLNVPRNLLGKTIKTDQVN